ncbi:MAG TPA: hypothetical protein VEU96_16190 [Bryobacteraceae bacterium]|nr:hypothetical protein [Bryobacteraceae bacterium]
MGEGKPAASNGVHEDLPHESIRTALHRVLQSQGFRSSRRSQDFLKYVVERTLEGQAESLKERTIGVDVFGRTAEYDPSDDATVRVKAGEVRKRLHLYYANEGQQDEIHIELPAGTYVPEFHTAQAHAPVAELPHAPRPGFRWWAVAGVALLATGLVAVTLWFKTRPAETPLDQFWAPVLRGSTPVLLSASYVPVYGVDPKMAPERPTRFEDFVLLNDQFVGGGDLMAVARLSAMLNRMHRSYRVKIGSDVTFQDLRAAPTVLVGYSYTRWREISKELRFFIDAEGRPRMVTDNGKPTQWALPELPPDRHTAEDYAIVTRVFHPDTQAMLVEVAGITQYGTEAGADLITNPEYMTAALRDAPKGWQNKNVQLVLHVKVISGTPTSPRVVATHFW